MTARHTIGVGVAAAILALSAIPPGGLAASSVFSANLSGKDEVPPKDTHATGHVSLMVSGDGNRLTYRVIVADIDNVIGAYVYLGSSTENGTVVATLYGPVAPGGGRKSGILARGTIAAASLTGQLTGRPLADLLEAMKSGETYVSVLTDDGIAPTDQKPGDLASGEIRGQLR